VKRNNKFCGSAFVVSRGVKSLFRNNQILIVIDDMSIKYFNINSNTGSQFKEK
jgi:hypothetical protein